MNIKEITVEARETRSHPFTGGDYSIGATVTVDVTDDDKAHLVGDTLLDNVQQVVKTRLDAWENERRIEAGQFRCNLCKEWVTHEEYEVSYDGSNVKACWTCYQKCNNVPKCNDEEIPF